MNQEERISNSLINQYKNENESVLRCIIEDALERDIIEIYKEYIIRDNSMNLNSIPSFLNYLSKELAQRGYWK